MDKEKRKRELRENITIQNYLMEQIAIARGNNFLELKRLCDEA